VTPEIPRDFSSFSVDHLLEFAYNTIKTVPGSTNTISVVRGQEPTYGSAPGWLIKITFRQADGTEIQIYKKDLDLRIAVEAAVNKLLTLK
jgi:hypothetical protein